MLFNILEQLKKKKERDIKKVHQYAANYFTKEKISELYRLSLEVLKSSPFNIDDYIKRFSDTSNFDIDDIDFLIQLQYNIVEVQEKLNSNAELSDEAKAHVKGMAKIMSIIADILSRKDEANDD